MLQFASQYVNLSISPSLFGTAIVLGNMSAKLVGVCYFDTLQLHISKCGPKIYVRRLYRVVPKLEVLQHVLSILGFKLGPGYHPYPLSAVHHKIGVLYITGQHI